MHRKWLVHNSAHPEMMVLKVLIYIHVLRHPSACEHTISTQNGPAAKYSQSQQVEQVEGSDNTNTNLGSASPAYSQLS